MAVADCGKMSEAARQLYISQSSVSQSIAAIENEYDILLFERLSRGLFLTGDGEKLLSYARNLLSVKKDMDDFLSNASHTHRLKVGATVTVGTCVISSILNEMKEKLTGIDISVSVANTHILEGMLLRSEIDVGLVEGKVSSADLIFRDAIDDELVLICGKHHPFFGRKQVSPDELSSENLILREKGSGTRALFEEQMIARHIPMTVGWSCYNSEAIRNAVADGHGVSVISRRLVENDIRQGRLWACGISDMDLKRCFAVVYHKNKFFSEELKTFIRCCEDFSRSEKSSENRGI